MFEDSLMESGGMIHTHQKWTVLISTLVQLLGVGVLILLPLFYLEALPKGQLLTFLVAPPPPPPPPPPAPPVIQHVQRVSEIVNGELRTPSKIPKIAKKIVEDEAPPPPTGVTGGVLGGVPGGSAGGVIGGIIGSTAAPPKVAAPTKLRISQGVLDGNRIKDVQPIYPNMAKVAHVQGDVVLRATISKTGAIENLQAISGHALLIPAAIDAVKQWRYKPWVLNNEAVEVDTVITVKFHM
ncbi:MAG TPA: TonB family protein [Candidatus Saccharimonadales bacterium]|jgi:protein TonB|nr:TonB family protein [Candidatus Saccharimonadales bacterium]